MIGSSEAGNDILEGGPGDDRYLLDGLVTMKLTPRIQRSSVRS